MTGISTIELEALSSRMLRALMKGSTNLVVLLATDGVIVDVGPSVTYLLGYDREDLIGRSVLDLIWPDDQESSAGILAQDAATARPGVDFTPDAEISGDYKVRHSDGSYVAFEITRSNFIAEPEINGVLVTGRRIGPRQVLTEALYVLGYDASGGEAMRRMLDYLAREMPDAPAAIRVDGGTEWIAIDDAIGPLCGGPGPWDDAIVSGKLALADLDDIRATHPELAERAARLGFNACWCVPLPILQPSAYPRFAPKLQEGLEIAGISDLESDLTRLGCLIVWARTAELPPGTYLSIMERVGLFAEIALRRKRDRDRIQRLLHYDHLTGALSRAGMRAIGLTGENSAAQIMIDLDDFKQVNDTHGHAVGDQLLRLATQRLTTTMRREDRIARLGGDEFLVLLQISGLESAFPAVQRMLAALAEPFQIGGLTVRIGASIGVAAHDPLALFETVTERADRAMYLAKQEGKNHWAAWHPDANEPGGGSVKLG